ncbi:MAG: ABC transporter ATP-binding protein [Deltaproteobacteria bacterium]|nr:ABC transporter ATP-binding protein [Deltaproteobacteria bacterium]
MKLIIDNLSFAYKSKDVLNDISFRVEKRELLSILGPNGVGKTTLLRCINRILKAQKGTVFVGKDNLYKMSTFEIAQNISYVPQHSRSSRLTAYDAILMGRRPYINWRVSQRDYDIVEKIIRRLDMGCLALRYIDEMSGGELQKVSIARALVQGPRVILMDEPTASLDMRNQMEILTLIREIVERDDIITVMSIHDINTALRFSEKLLFVKDGKIHSAISPSQIEEKIIEDVYGVRVKIQEINNCPVVFPLESIIKEKSNGGD